MPIYWDRVNYLAVVVAGLAMFFLGGLWYQALFGKLWVRLHGYTPEQVEAMKKKRPPAVFFGSMIASYLVASFCMALIGSAFQMNTVMAGAGLGLLLWLSAAAIGMTGHIASDKPLAIYLIDTAFQFCGFILMGIILGAWN